MTQFRKTIKSKIFAPVLVLAILMSLTGHVFLHLADEPFQHEASHQVSAHHEDSAAQNQSHQCSICLDHQALSLDLPARVFELFFSAPVSIPQTVAANYQANRLLFTADRAPPRS
jgi:hypothetical protein